MYQSNECRDLFGEYVITFDDVEWWLNNIPVHLSSSPKRRAKYASNYNIKLKIAALKSKNAFNLFIGDTESIKNNYQHDSNYREIFISLYREFERLKDSELAALKEKRAHDDELRRNQRRAICLRARRAKATKNKNGQVELAA